MSVPDPDFLFPPELIFLTDEVTWNKESRGKASLGHFEVHFPRALNIVLVPGRATIYLNEGEAGYAPPGEPKDLNGFGWLMVSKRIDYTIYATGETTKGLG